MSTSPNASQNTSTQNNPDTPITTIYAAFNKKRHPVVFPMTKGTAASPNKAVHLYQCKDFINLTQAIKLLNEGEEKYIWLVDMVESYNYGLASTFESFEEFKAIPSRRDYDSHNNDVRNFRFLAASKSDEYYVNQQLKSVNKSVLYQITREEYMDSLEVLPPMNWHTYKGNEVFFSSEYTSGDITRMFCKVSRCENALSDENGYVYYEKNVVYTDKSTWIDNKLILARKAFNTSTSNDNDVPEELFKLSYSLLLETKGRAIAKLLSLVPANKFSHSQVCFDTCIGTKTYRGLALTVGRMFGKEIKSLEFINEFL